MSALAIGAMLLMRRNAPDGSYFHDGDRAAGVFGVLATGFAVALGFVVFLAFTSYDDARTGAETEALIVAQQVETAQFFPAPADRELTVELVCYARSVAGVQWDRMEAGMLGEELNPWAGELFRTSQLIHSTLLSYLETTRAGEWEADNAASGDDPATARAIARREEGVHTEAARPELGTLASAELLTSLDSVTRSRRARVAAASREIPAPYVATLVVSGLVLILNAGALTLRSSARTALLTVGLAGVVGLSLALLFSITAPWRGSIVASGHPMDAIPRPGSRLPRSLALPSGIGTSSSSGRSSVVDEPDRGRTLGVRRVRAGPRCSEPSRLHAKPGPGARIARPVHPVRTRRGAWTRDYVRAQSREAWCAQRLFAADAGWSSRAWRQR